MNLGRTGHAMDEVMANDVAESRHDDGDHSASVGTARLLSPDIYSRLDESPCRGGLDERLRFTNTFYSEEETIFQSQSQRPLPPLPESFSSAFPPISATAGMTASNSNSFPPLDTSFNNRSPSPASGGQVNGVGMNNSANYMAPLPVGHQQDLNYLYAQIQELSGLLQSNREKVNDITRSAEEVARRANGLNDTTDPEADHEADKARLRNLEHELTRSRQMIELYKHEQMENTKLIAMYEDALGTATDQIRGYCNDIDSRFLNQRRHYNNLLQAEKDEHLQSRLDRDHWHAQTLRLAEMIRTAYRLRCKEWGEEYRVVVGLQTEVRCLRRCLGMEAEKPEEETGWEYLKDAPFDDRA